MKFPLAHQPIYICLLFFLLLGSVSFVYAEEPLTLRETIQLATQNQPLLQSLDDAAASAREAAIAEGQLPDPKIKFGIINLPVTTRDALRYNRDDQTMANVGISQDVIPLKKRELASNRLLTEADQFQIEQIATVRTIERDVALAWLDVYEAQRKSELYQQTINEWAAERKVLAAGVSSGGAKVTEVIRMDAEISMTIEKRIYAERDERIARAALARWIGPSASRPISVELPITSKNMIGFNEKEVAFTEVQKHPQLQILQINEKLAQLDIDRAKANLERNWGWEVGYGKRFNDRSDMLTFQVSIDLQLDRANRQDRRIAEKLVLINKAQKLTEDKTRELSRDLKDAFAEAQSAEERENLHVSSLIPISKARLSVAQAGYAAGKNILTEVWEARRSVIQIRLDHWTILTDIQRAAVKIAYYTNDSNIFKQLEKE